MEWVIKHLAIAAGFNFYKQGLHEMGKIGADGDKCQRISLEANERVVGIKANKQGA